MKLEGKTALITGGAQGIGQAIATAFAEEGANVIIADIKPCEALIEDLRSREIQADSHLVDITDEQAIVDLFASIDELSILVNNAGTYGPVKHIVDMDRESWDEAFALNLTAAMLCSREALKKMIEGGSGNIINISSNVARRGLPNRGCYVASKWALLGLTQTMALENAEKNIRVNAILPGPVLTTHLDEVMKVHAEVEGKDLANVAEDWRTCAPMKRFVEPSEISSVATFLASDMSSAMTGQSINVTCGFIMN